MGALHVPAKADKHHGVVRDIRLAGGRAASAEVVLRCPEDELVRILQMGVDLSLPNRELRVRECAFKGCAGLWVRQLLVVESGPVRIRAPRVRAEAQLGHQWKVVVLRPASVHVCEDGAPGDERQKLGRDEEVVDAVQAATGVSEGVSRVVRHVRVDRRERAPSHCGCELGPIVVVGADRFVANVPMRPSPQGASLPLASIMTIDGGHLCMACRSSRHHSSGEWVLW